MIGIEINNIFKDIKDIDLPIKEITDIIYDDIQKNILDSKVLTKDYEGDLKDPKKLNQDYRNWKSKKLGYTNVFYGKGLKLIRSVKRRYGKGFGEIYINLPYAKYVNEIRPFWGISKNAVKEIDKTLELKTKLG